MNAGIVLTAANIRGGGDSPVTLAELKEVYPQFASEALPEAWLQMTLDSANAAIQSARWHSLRKQAICLYVAHFATLYLKTLADPAASPTAIARKGDGSGNVTSKSVGGVSVSYGSAEGSSDLTGYGAWKETEFGQQLATMARMVGKGMMVVR
ncbi:MAG: DUF4054 domain-containing protein [Oscillospiraceae bacterium]|nr:DUF4054 domain-containing protein [Oscillospiraceae bacterium]